MAAGSVYAKHSGKLLALLYLLQPVAAADKPEGDQLVRLAFTPLSLLVSVQAPSKDLSVMCEVPAATFSVYEVRDCGVFPQNYEPTTCGTTGRPPSNLSVVFFVNIHLLIAAIASVDSLHDVVLNFNQTNCRLNVAVRSPPVKVVASLAVQCFDVPDEWPPQVDSASEVALPGLFFYTLIKRCVSHCSPRSLIILSLRPADSAGEARFGIRVSEHCSTCCEVELPYSSNSLSDLKCIQPLECLFNSRTLMQCAKAVSSCGEVRFIFPIEPNSRGAGVCRPVCALVKTSLKTLPISVRIRVSAVAAQTSQSTRFEHNQSPLFSQQDTAAKVVIPAGHSQVLDPPASQPASQDLFVLRTQLPSTSAAERIRCTRVRGVHKR
ncbi:MAG: hypothetical protein KVP17_003811 [Porospora cf. gigantea B]|uniref:uncharacterized protein n=1 Tax=Porospora cf. gigantea B TaxID=2853592 RepID=UPI0035717C71|nr:MAG: hypothetical protein KVP17_003811 [Porospora cf. gigantea B]